MPAASLLDIHSEVAEALRDRQPVVALESTLIAHGLPWPVNLETARAAETAVREEGAVPATIAVWQGRPAIGLDTDQLETLARNGHVHRASRRDLAACIALRRTAATTVSATMVLAHQAGIRLFATGGIGGAHRAIAASAEGNGRPAVLGHSSWDISADLRELATTPVAVVCAGAKCFLDIPRTLEILESNGVPVLGYGTDDFPGFYLRSSGEKVPTRVDTPHQVAELVNAHWSLGGAGVVIAQPVAASAAVDPEELEQATAQAEKEAAARELRGHAVTPFVLGRLAELTNGKTLRTNQALVIANAQLAARLARVLAEQRRLGVV
jgi:pseudouridine-5'-phosphate glycosidase